VCQRIGATPGPPSHRQAYHEIGHPETLRGRDKIFALDRRGGYPWAEGFFGRNDTAPLPATLANDGRPAGFPLRIGDPVRACADRVRRVLVRAVLLGAREGDELEARVNGVPVPLAAADHGWKDPGIFSPAPQPPSGGAASWQIDPAQKLLRLDFLVPPRLCHLGENEISLRIVDRVPYMVADIVLEKLEVHVEYEGT
jgi:hypothetical protein